MRLLVSHPVASAHGTEISARAAAAGDAIELIADYASFLENAKRWQRGAA